MTKKDLYTRLYNAGTGEWVRRGDRDEMLRVAALCIEALDELQKRELELAPGGSQAQPNTAVLESGIKTASLPEEFTTYVDAAMNADAAKYRRADEPTAKPWPPAPPKDASDVARVVGEIRDKVDGDIMDWLRKQADPSADAKDAARWRRFRELAQESLACGIEVNDEKLSYEQPAPGKAVRLYWYPNTPVGFNQANGDTIDDAIEHLL